MKITKKEMQKGMRILAEGSQNKLEKIFISMYSYVE